MTKRLIDVTPEGIADYFEYNDSDESFTVHTVADVTSTIEANKRMAADGTNGFSKSRDFRHIAEIPVSLLHEWLVKEGINWADRNDWPKIMQKVRSNEYAFLRTAGGKI